MSNETNKQDSSLISTKTTEIDVANLNVKIANEKHSEKQITANQKMDKLLRDGSHSQLKKEIESLKKETAKYQNDLSNATEQNNNLQKLTNEIYSQIDDLKRANKELAILRTLDNAGCIKSDLVIKDIPADCDNLQHFIDEYKEANPFLFKKNKLNIGSNFKTSNTKSLSPSQQMDAYIRAALGR